MNEEMKDILLVTLGGVALFAGIYFACFLTEKYQAWRRKKDDEEYEAWREKRHKDREARQALRKAESRPEETSPSAADLPLTKEPADEGEATSARERSAASRTRLALAYEYAGRAQTVYRNRSGLVEAYFYAQLAKMNGHRQISALLSQIRVTWRQMGYPTEKGMLHDDFTEVESAMGRACLRIDSRYEKSLGEASLRELAEAGVEMARDLLAERFPDR